MFEIKRLDGTVVLVTDRKLESMRMLMDWQIREMGYDEASINSALREPSNKGNHLCYQVVYENWFGRFATLTDAILFAHKLGKGAKVYDMYHAGENEWEAAEIGKLVYEE